MNWIKRFVNRALFVTLAFAALAATGVMATPSKPAFAQSGNCGMLNQGLTCGSTEECVVWKKTAFSLGAGLPAHGQFGVTWTCAKTVRYTLRFPKTKTNPVCLACHGSGSSGSSGGEAAGADDPWCDDPDRAATTPVYCGVNKERQT